MFGLLYFGCNSKPIPQPKQTAHTLKVSEIASIEAKYLSLHVWRRLDSLQRALDELRATSVAQQDRTRYSAKYDTTIMSNELPFYHGMYDTIIIHK